MFVYNTALKVLLNSACSSCNHVIHNYCPTAITVMFTEIVYSVIENNGPAQPVLVLSNPSATSFDVTVTNTDGSATGEYFSILINY